MPSSALLFWVHRPDPARGSARSRHRKERTNSGRSVRERVPRHGARGQKNVIIAAVEQAGGNYTEAARRLGLHPNYLHRLIRNLNLKPLLRQAAGES